MNFRKPSLASLMRGLSSLLHRLADIEEMQETMQETEPAITERGKRRVKLVDADLQALAEIARREYASRRARDQHLPVRFLGEPMWDLLLDLFIHSVQGRCVPVTSAAIAACAPLSTTLRYIAVLQREGLVESQAGKVDRRLNLLTLTPRGIEQMALALGARLEWPADLQEFDRLLTLLRADTEEDRDAAQG